MQKIIRGGANCTGSMEYPPVKHGAGDPPLEFFENQEQNGEF